jgi:hypothetical protein
VAFVQMLAAIPLARAPLAAQTQAPAWALTATASLESFRGAASDTTASGLAVRPSRSLAIGLGLIRRWRPWAVSLQVSHLTGHIEAVSDELVVQDRTEALDRTRLALMLARRIGQPGAGTLELRLGPTLDGWSIGNDDVRSTIGGAIQLAIDFPAGPVTFEHALGVSWSSSPFRAAELPEGYRRVGLRAVALSAGIRCPL